MAAAFPGTGDQGWLAFVALVPLLMAIAGTTRWRAAGLGFVAGLMFWLATIPWVAQTMVRYGGLPWPLASLILLGLVGYLALYTAAFCALLCRCPTRSGALYVILAASLWVALEFLRTYLLTGFPWNLLGYSQHRNLALIQVAAATGVYGVSFLVMAVNAAVARALLSWKRWPGLFVPLGTAGLLLVGALGYGWLWPPPEDGKPPMRVALVQGSIDQSVKWEPAWQARTLAIYQDLTVKAARERPQLIVWPEAAVPFLLREDPRRAAVEGMARAADAYLLVGAPNRQAAQPRNTAFLIGPDGQMVGRYDKRHLVPFGEYVPLRQLLFFVNPLAGGAIGEFAPGHEATVFATPSGRFSVVICYEAIFPEEVRDFFRSGADFLVNITNDAWFGRSAAPVQHLAMAAFRAVENRAYLIRAANTGISAIVAPDGPIVQASELFTPAVLSGAIVPHADASFYTRYGDLFAWGTVGIALVTAIDQLVPIVLPSWSAPRDGMPARGRCPSKPE
ncbi:MAG: apolipoprotein N-acyltransferase [Candidatus Entotheonellia bacterium]